MIHRSTKVFEDSVHGHIVVPAEYCDEIIDSAIFQRLRHIEQTSVRSIFPSAVHNRFIHSLGVFHIGDKLFSSIENNMNDDIRKFVNGDKFTPTPHIKQLAQKVDGKAWEVLRRTYRIACLLHDCGHAPFSHNLEVYYEKNELEKNEKSLDDDLIDEYKKCAQALTISGGIDQDTIESCISDFKLDIKHGNQPSQHERVSAWLVLHENGFREKLIRVGADPLLAARMIIGCHFNEFISETKTVVSTSDESKQLLNCFISILNGHEIDADRLDYVLRDSWATGLKSNALNINNIFASVSIVKMKNRKYTICFAKKSFSELHSILDAKNHNEFWVFNHHKVKYDDWLLVKAVGKLALLLSGKRAIDEYIGYKRKIAKPGISLDEKERLDKQVGNIENKALSRLINYKNLLEPQTFTMRISGETYNEILYLLNDADLICLLKKYFLYRDDLGSNLLPGLKDNPRKNMSNLELFFTTEKFASEWFSRERCLRPIWKSYSEFSAKYMRIFSMEANSIKKFLTLISKLSTTERKDINKYIDIMTSNSDLCPLLHEIESYKNDIGISDTDSYISSILRRYNGSSVRKELYDNILSELNTIQDQYLDKKVLIPFLAKSSKKITTSLIEKFKKKGLSYSPKMMQGALVLMNDCNLKKLKSDSINVSISDDIIRYTDLNLPIKNQETDYNFFYIFIPSPVDASGKDKDKIIYKKVIKSFRKDFFQEILVNCDIYLDFLSLLKIPHPENRPKNIITSSAN